jgi:Recombinase
MIAKTLNSDSVPGPGGAAWGPSTINGNATRGTGILNNELYIGRLVWNRLRYLKDPSPKALSRSNSRVSWLASCRSLTAPRSAGIRKRGRCKSRWLRGPASLGTESIEHLRWKGSPSGWPRDTSFQPNVIGWAKACCHPQNANCSDSLRRWNRV